MSGAGEASRVYLRNPDVVMRDEDDDGALLFNPDTNQVLVLNSTAVCVWKNCDGQSDSNVIARAVKEEFDDVPGDTVESDVDKFLSDMAAGGFIGLAGQ